MPVRFKVKVKCLETGQVYESINKAAFAEDVDEAAIRLSIKTGRKKAGKTFVRVEEGKDGGINKQ